MNVCDIPPQFSRYWAMKMETGPKITLKVEQGITEKQNGFCHVRKNRILWKHTFETNLIDDIIEHNIYFVCHFWSCIDFF